MEKWIKWFPSRWSSNEFVKDLSFEELGLYFSLLNWQMERGSISADPKKQVSYIGHGLTEKKMSEIWEKLRTRFKKKTKSWVSTSYFPDTGYWVPLTEDEMKDLHKEGDRYHNDFMERVLACSQRKTDKLATNGSLGGQTRVQNQVINKLEKEVLENPHATEVIKFILKNYPKRKNRLGWEEGLEMAALAIDTEESIQRFEAALNAYKQESRGQESKYIKRLDKFMSEWTGYVPDGFKPVLKLVPKPAETAEDGSWVRQKRVLSPESKPPWVPRREASEESKKRLAEYWTPERQEKWWYNEPLDETQDEKTKEIK